jgi:hypothetical protein
MLASTGSNFNGHYSHGLSGGKPKRAALSGPPALANREGRVEVEILHPNIQGEVINKAYEANDRSFDAALFNARAEGRIADPKPCFSAIRERIP